MRYENEKNTLNTQIQYKMIEKLSTMNTGLQEEVSVRKAAQLDLEKSNEELKKALQVKSDFLSTMSHEIRTPLNIIIGYTQVLQKEQFHTKQQAHFDSIKFAADSLLNIVDQILQYSKLDSDHFVLFEREFSLNDLLMNFSHAFEERANKKELDYSLEVGDSVPNIVFGDDKKIQQIIYNLIGNAFKFTNSGSIHLKVGVVDEQESICYLKFTVTDTGIGIEEEDVKTIFERFQQVQSDIKREYGGVGLGLAITKKLTHFLNGSLEVESEKGKGSSFSFTIPLKKVNNADLKSKKEQVLEEKKPLKGLNILLAEDDKSNQVLAKTVLKDLGCNIVVANNGQEAFDLAKEEIFDVILMDLHMPIMNGYESSREIQKCGIKVPILGFSADVFAETKKMVSDAGMKGLIPKPFTIDYLINCIRDKV